MKSSFASAALAALVSLTFGGELKLAEDGKALADIVIAERPDRAAMFGAYEVSNILHQVTGAGFRIVRDSEPPSGRKEIRIGESRRTRHKASELKVQESVIDVTEDAVELVGVDKDDKSFRMTYRDTPGQKGFSLFGMPGMHDRMASLTACYRFLERNCGVRFTEPSVWGTLIPSRRTLVLETGVERYRPFFGYRGGSISPGGDFEWGNWDGRRFRQHPSRKAYNELAYPGCGQGARAAIKRRFLLRRGGGGEFAEVNHSFHYLFRKYWEKDSKSFIEFRPELFAKGYPEKPPQLCYTSPELIRQVTEDAQEYLSATGTYTRAYGGGRTVGETKMKFWGDTGFVLEPLDNSFFCRCPRCKRTYEPDRGDWSEHSTCWYSFVNAVAREVRKTHPWARIRTLAYASHKGLPTGIRLEDNVDVFFCLTSSGAFWTDSRRKEMELLESWHRAYPNQTFGLWLYNCMCCEAAGYGGYHCFPPAFAHEAGRQYRDYRRLNAGAGTFYCGASGYCDSYVQLRLAFEPELEVESALADFFAPYDGAAGKIRAFYDLLERRYGDKSLRPRGLGGIRLQWSSICPKETLLEFRRLMAEAEAEADTPRAKAKVAMWRRDMMDYMEEGMAQYEDRTATPEPKWTAAKVSEAGGVHAKVPWATLREYAQPLYLQGTTNASQFAAALRFAHDSTHLYVELAISGLETAKLVNSPTIVCNDEIEFVISRQRAQPYRGYFSAPDGRMSGSSFGEVNWRWDVKASESGDVSYGARCVSDCSDPHRWTMRYAFPLATMSDRPFKPGETVMMNAAAVFGSEICGSRCAIFTVTPYTSVHVVDRIGEILLEK